MAGLEAMNLKEKALLLMRGLAGVALLGLVGTELLKV